MDDRQLTEALIRVAERLARYNAEAHPLRARKALPPELRQALRNVIVQAIVLLPPQPSGGSHTCPNCGNPLTVTVNVT